LIFTHNGKLQQIKTSCFIQVSGKMADIWSPQKRSNITALLMQGCLLSGKWPYSHIVYSVDYLITPLLPLRIKLPYVDSFSCENFRATVFSTTSTFVRQFLVRQVIFTTSTIVRNIFDDRLFDDKHVSATVFSATRFLCESERGAAPRTTVCARSFLRTTVNQFLRRACR
jgi:hypothetical protein